MFRNFDDVQAYVDRHGKARLVEQLSRNAFPERVEELVLDGMEADGSQEELEDNEVTDEWVRTERAELMPDRPRAGPGRITRWVAGFFGMTAVATVVLLLSGPHAPAATDVNAPPALKASTALASAAALSKDTK